MSKPQPKISMKSQERVIDVSASKTDWDWNDFPAGTKTITTSIDFCASFTREETPLYMTDASSSGLLTVTAYKEKGSGVNYWVIFYSVLPCKNLDSHKDGKTLEGRNYAGFEFQSQKLATMAVELLARCDWEVVSDAFGNNGLQPSEDAKKQLEMIRQVDEIEFENSLERRSRRKIAKYKEKLSRIRNAS